MASTMRISSFSSSYPYTIPSTNFSDEPKLDDVLNNPMAYGFTKTFPDALSDTALTDKNFMGPGRDYVFWDDIHPTSKVHEMFAAWTYAAIANSVLEQVGLIASGNQVNLRLSRLKICREYTIQSSGNLVNWKNASTFIANAGTNQVSLAPPSESATFYRLKWDR